MRGIAIFFGTGAAIWAVLYFVLKVVFCIALAWALAVMLFMALGLGFTIFYSGDADK